MNTKLLIVLVLSQVLLWASYVYFLSLYPQEKFWGNIPQKNWREFLLYAGIAYILNLSLYLYYVFKKDISERMINEIIYTLIAYYGLQLFFLPFVLHGSKIAVQILLFMCIFPLLYLSYITINYSKNINSNTEKVFLYTTSILPLAHIVINDFIRYGFKF